MIKFILGIAMVLTTLTTFAAQGAPSLKALTDQYAALPTLPNEKMLEHLMNNPIFEEAITNPKLEKTMSGFGPAEQAVIKKQFLLAEIYKQALRELRGPHSKADLTLLFLGGLVPGTDPEIVTLPTIERLSNLRVLHDVIRELTLREENTATLALDILKMKGIRYPSTDSFARGLARYAAVSAVDADLFDRILNTFDRLYTLKRTHPIPRGGREFERYHIATIAREIPHPAYNPAIAQPGLREKIVSNLLTQIGKRRGPVRGDLIEGLVQIDGDPRILPFAESILRTSTDSQDLVSAILGIRGLAKNQKLILLIASQLNRYTEIPPETPKTRSVLDQAMDTIMMPFYVNQEDRARPLRDLALKLLRHSKSAVRERAIAALKSDVFTVDEVNHLTKTLLADPAESVRKAALNSLWSAGNHVDGHKISGDLDRLITRDPSPTVRKWAADAREEVMNQRARQCQMLFYPEGD